MANPSVAYAHDNGSTRSSPNRPPLIFIQYKMTNDEKTIVALQNRARELVSDLASSDLMETEKIFCRFQIMNEAVQGLSELEALGLSVLLHTNLQCKYDGNFQI